MALWSPENYHTRDGAWWDFTDDAAATESGGALTDLVDKFGNGYDLVQATSAKRGTRSANANLNGLKTVVFPSAGGMSSATKPAIGPSTWHLGTGLTIDELASPGLSFPKAMIGITRFEAGSVPASGSALHQINGAAVTTSGVGATYGVAGTLIFCGRALGTGQNGFGRIGDNSASAYYVGNRSAWDRLANVEIAHIILLQHKAADADLEYFAGWWCHASATEGELPTGHAFETSPPTVASPRAWGAIIG